MQMSDLNLLKRATDCARMTVTMVTFREMFKVKKKNKKQLNYLPFLVLLTMLITCGFVMIERKKYSRREYVSPQKESKRRGLISLYEHLKMYYLQEDVALHHRYTTDPANSTAGPPTTTILRCLLCVSEQALQQKNQHNLAIQNNLINFLLLHNKLPEIQQLTTTQYYDVIISCVKSPACSISPQGLIRLNGGVAWLCAQLQA